MKRILFALLACLLCSHANATPTASAAAGDTRQYGTGIRQIHWSALWTQTSTTGGGRPVYTLTGTYSIDAGDGFNAISNFPIAINYAEPGFSGSYTATVSTDVPPAPTKHTITFKAGGLLLDSFEILPGYVPYSVSFVIPANPHNSNDPDPASPHIKYTFTQMQAGVPVVVGSLDVYGGAAQQTVNIGNLATNDPVICNGVIVRTNFVDTPVGPIPIQTPIGNLPSVSATPTNTGTPTAATASNQGQATATSNVSTTPIAPAVTPSAPVSPVAPAAPTSPAPTVTPTPTRGAPSPLGIPFGSTPLADSTAAKTSDIATAANAIVDGISKGTASAVEVGNAIIESNNATAKAVIDTGKANVDGHNATAKAVTDGANGVITAVNDAKAQHTKDANGVIAAVNGVKQQIASSSNPGTGFTYTGPYGSGDIGTGLSAASAAASAQPAYSGAHPSATTQAVTFAASQGIPNVVMHVGNVDVNLGANTADMGGAIGLLRACRGLLLVALCVWFVRSCSSTFEAYVIGLSNAGQGSSALTGAENVLPGVAQAKNLASASAIVAVTLTACAAVVALIDTIAGHYGVTIATLFNAFDLSAAGPGIGYIDQFIPIAAAAGLSILRAGVSYAIAPIYLAATSAARFLHV